LMQSYWNRIYIYYRDLTCYKIDGNVLMDISDIYLIPIFLSCSCILIAAIVDFKSSA
jgi:hypothetical protein